MTFTRLRISICGITILKEDLKYLCNLYRQYFVLCIINSINFFDNYSKITVNVTCIFIKIINDCMQLNRCESNRAVLIESYHIFFYDKNDEWINFAIIKHCYLIILFYTANISYNFDLWNFIRNINHFMNDLHIYVWVMVTEFSSGPLSGVSQIFLQGCRHLDSYRKMFLVAWKGRMK